MAFAVESPAREDLSFRTNDDKRIGARWTKSDGVTPVVIESAKLTLRFDVLLSFDADGYPLPLPPPTEHEISSTTPTDPGGYIDVSGFASGTVLVSIPHTVWSTYSTDERSGTWDLYAVGEGVQRVLVRGRFAVEEGVSS